MSTEKKKVHDFWNEASCGEELYLSEKSAEGYRAQSKERYRLEPYILNFANFEDYEGVDVLEIGLGLGADHQGFAENGANMHGVDLTERAVSHTSERLKLFGLETQVRVGDAENLPFEDGRFDLVYSWGVIHHSPNTPQAVKEIFRVLKDGGEAKVMIYHKYSFVGLMLWLRYGLLKGRPWTSLEKIYADYLESPGTKAYTVKEAEEMFSDFSEVVISTVLTHADLLESEAGQRHKGGILSLAKKVWPRSLIRKFFPQYGLFMMIYAVK